MSSTRQARDGGDFHQERFCSHPEIIGNGINGLAAAKRIALVGDPTIRELLWFIQFRSISENGVEKLCEDLLSRFPNNIGSFALYQFRKSGRSQPNRAQMDAFLREDEFNELSLAALFCSDNAPADRVADPTESASEVLKRKTTEANAHVRTAVSNKLLQCCLDPHQNLKKDTDYFQDLAVALSSLRSQSIQRAQSRLADTEVSRQIIDTLDFFYATRRMVLIEGVAGIGRSATARAWCDSHPGLVRYVEVPSSSDDRSFYSAIARALGVANGASYKAQQIRDRVEEMLLTSGIALVFDESQYLWGQFIRPRRTPDRILWIKTLYDAGTPIALVAHTDFSKWQKHYVEKTLWTDEQFERRLNRRVNLPAVHSTEDMLKIARAHMPDGEPRSWKLLSAYALGTEKKQASGIVEALESAQYHARQEGRSSAEFPDIEWALTHVHGFLEAATSQDVQALSKSSAKPLKKGCLRISPAVDSSVLLPSPGTKRRVYSTLTIPPA